MTPFQEPSLDTSLLLISDIIHFETLKSVIAFSLVSVRGAGFTRAKAAYHTGGFRFRWI
jgi:hypothetical protein